MRAFIFICLWALSGAVLADAGVSTDAGTNIEQTTDKGFTRDKTISVDKTQSNTVSQDKERERSQTTAINQASSYGLSQSAQLSSVLVPMVQAIERGELGEVVSPVVRQIRNCGLMTYQAPVPSALFISHPASIANAWGNAAQYRGSLNQYLEPSGAMPPYESFSGEALYVYSDGMERKVRRFAPPSEAVKCYVLYAELFSQTILALSKQGKVSRGRILDVDGFSVEQIVAVHLVRLIKSQSFTTGVDAKVQHILDGGCLLPGLPALNDGQYDWQCGTMKVDVANNKVLLAGNTYFGDNVFNGVSGEISLAVTGEQSSGYAKASVERETQSKATENSKGTSLTKGKSQSTGSSTRTTVSGGSTTAN